jgi:GntR family transcriptional regulator
MYIRITENSPESRWRQIYAAIADRILIGELKPGDEIPSIRQLAADTTVSVITVKRAYQQLEAEGFIFSQQGRGTFVAEFDQEQLRSRRLAEWRNEFSRIVQEGKRLGLSGREISTEMKEYIRKEGDDG